MKLSFLLPCNINSTPNEYYDYIKEVFNFWQPVLLEQKTEQQVIGEWDVWAYIWASNPFMD